jgi:peptide/nickel transport system substrate-binding protein
MVATGLVIAIAFTACSPGKRVDLGDESSQNLIAAISGEPDQLDPHKTSAYFSFEVLENVYDTLVEPDDSLEMRPALAASWELSDDQLIWTFHLRQGVMFHDGSPFSADDVVYSYRRIIDQKLSNADRFHAVTGVTAPDKSTVKITVAQPTPNLLSSIGGFKGMAIVQRRNVESGQIATHPIGTGPFAFKSAKSGDSITLMANKNCWRGPPAISGVTFPLYPRGVHGFVSAAGRRDRLDGLGPHPARRGTQGRRVDQPGCDAEQRLLVPRAERSPQAA